MSLPPKLGTLTPDSFFIQLVNKIDKLCLDEKKTKKSMKSEIRSLEFWRSIIAECLSCFFYVFLVCAVHISWTGSLIGHQTNWVVISLTSGFSMATLTKCFGHISGANVNPAVTCSLLITRKISPLRAAFYILAHCGGAIAGAAFLYGVSITSHQGALGISMPHESLGPQQIFGIEFVLTFLIVFTIFATFESNHKLLTNDSVSIGIAYMVGSFAGLPGSGASLNPARALGPAFVMNRWKFHWVYWVAPITGGMLAGLIYEFIFDAKKSNSFIKDVLYDFEKGSNVDNFEEPEVKIIDKSNITYSGSRSTSGSSSSSNHLSNHTGYSSINNGQHLYSCTSPSTNFHQNILNSEGIYVTSNRKVGQLANHIHPITTLPSNYHHVNNVYGGIYGTKTNSNGSGNINSRMDYVSQKDIDLPLNQHTAKF